MPLCSVPSKSISMKAFNDSGGNIYELEQSEKED